MSRHWRRRRPDAGCLQVHPHPSGPWLVQAGQRLLVVDPQVGRDLLARPGVRLGAGAGPARRGRGLLVHATLLPAPVVRALARGLAPAASGAGLAFLAAAGLAAVACLRPWTLAGGFSWPALLLFAAGAGLHELGHAAALHRAGYAPGAIGVGVCVVVPVLFADVSAVCLLPRGARVRVDLAGPAFQAGAAGMLAVVAAAAAGPLAAAAATAALASLVALAWSLLPLARSDGTWALRDALGPEDGVAARAGAAGTPGTPGTPASPASPARDTARRLEAALAAVRVAMTVLACCLLPVRVAALAAAATAAAGWHLPAPARVALAALLQLGALAVLVAVAMRAWRRRRRAARAAGPSTS